MICQRDFPKCNGMIGLNKIKIMINIVAQRIRAFLYEINAEYAQAANTTHRKIT
jgi:hypothetical protein